jgi:hypothetical protein
MDKPSESASKLAKLIIRAIDDGELTNAEHDQIMAQADADSVIDSQERNLLAQLHDLLEDGTVKRVP